MNQIIMIPHVGLKLNKLKNSDLIIASHLLNYFLQSELFFRDRCCKSQPPIVHRIRIVSLSDVPRRRSLRRQPECGRAPGQRSEERAPQGTMKRGRA